MELSNLTKNSLAIQRGGRGFVASIPRSLKVRGNYFISSSFKAISDPSESTPSASPSARIGEVSIQTSNDIFSQTILSTLSSSRELLLDNTPLEYALPRG